MKEAITKVINEFAKQSFGDKVSSFSMTGLHLAIMQTIDKIEAESKADKAVSVKDDQKDGVK